MSEQISVAGWREWLALPEFNIPRIEVKVDTGAQTSVLHTSFIEPIHQHGKLWVRFVIHPLPERSDLRMIGFEPVIDHRMVKGAEGVDEVCYVVKTTVLLGENQKIVELALTSKDVVKFRMVLGRSSLQRLNLLVDSSQTHLFEHHRSEKKSPLQSTSLYN